MTDIERVSAANQSFYIAHETRNIEAMTAIWEHSDRVVCVHPGWPILRGWDDVLQSWVGIFRGPGQSQFILTNELVVADGTLAYVSIDENLVDESGSTSSTSGLNIFSWNDGRWLMVVHHASPIMSR